MRGRAYAPGMFVLARTTVAPWNGWSLFVLMIVVGIFCALAGMVANRRDRG